MDAGTTAFNCLVTVNYVDPTTNPPTPGVIAVDMPKSHAIDDSTLQTDIDSALTVATSNTMDWTL